MYLCVWSTAVATQAPPASEREVERGSPWPPRFSPSLSPAALSVFGFSPRLPKNKAPSCPRRGPLGAREPARPLPRELCNLHKAEDIHAGSRGPRARRLRRPLSRQQQRQPRQPHGRPGPQRAPGLEWRRQRVAAAAPESPHLEAAAATPLRPRAACASPDRTIDGRRCRENSMERGPGRGRGAGAGSAARGRPGARGRRGPDAGRCFCSPRAEERRLSREAAGEPGTRARTPPGTAAASLPPSPSRVPSPLPTPNPRGRGGALLSPAACASGSERSGLTVSDTPGP